jgi:translation initiation factor 2 subunit 2
MFNENNFISKNSQKNDIYSFRKGKKENYILEYDYQDLLDRFLKILQENTTSNLKGQRLSIEPPKIGRDGTKKTIFLNFEKICKKLGREKQHITLYISTELGTTASFQDSGALVLKGKFHPKGFENILTNYIKEYVLCGSCQSSNTILEKDSETRLIFLRCNTCQAWRSVIQIRPGFIAQTKKKRN